MSLHQRDNAFYKRSSHINKKTGKHIRIKSIDQEDLSCRSGGRNVNITVEIEGIKLANFKVTADGKTGEKKKKTYGERSQARRRKDKEGK